ncbi:NADH dehydrogenase (ubiquinone) 30 kDa subunit [Dehalogenimonas lykanthroporepellens BL-DC-9]|jgi:NADH-quinone oxidoreductase subunit C|nr:NADH dehydrogenase (ubiquinone) 30 kDa subunit [Dehalogenimonas lykanthroporepellens BL-DC-9]
MNFRINPATAGEAINREFGTGTAAADDVRLLVDGKRLLEVCRWLKDESPYRLDYLNSLTAVDNKTHFSVVYHLSSLAMGGQLSFKVDLDDRQSPSLPSVTPVWRGADLQEREVFDMFGISFTGHPCLKRLFLWEGFPGYPLRKDWVSRDS